jgi:nitroreductase
MPLEKPATTAAPIHELMQRRWSTRAFDASRPVSRAEILSLLEAARWAPSCNGVEPWRFIVCDRATDPASFDRAFDCLSPGNRLWAGNAQLFILAVAANDPLSGGRPNRFSQYDTGMAMMSLCLQAVALGLVAHQMAGYDVAKATALFGVPAECTPMAMVAIGRQASPDVLDEETKKKELAPRARKALGERFFEGEWGKPASS